MKSQRDEILWDSTTDRVELWTVPWSVREFMEIDDDHRVKEVSVDIIRELLIEQLIVPGDIDWSERDFTPWTGEPSAWLTRIVKEWSELERDPRPLEIAYFIATPKGERRVRLKE